MKTVRYLVYGIFLVVAFHAAEQPVGAYIDCHEVGCSADRHIIECGGYWEPIGDCFEAEDYWRDICSNLGPDPYFSLWSCWEEQGWGNFHFFCSYQGEPC